MKFFIVLCFSLCCAPKAFNQNVFDYAAIDREALAIPVSQTHTTLDIAGYINAHFNTDNKKVRAIYTWVAANIRYSSDSMRPIIFEEDREQKIITTLRRRKGVCENYAEIFNDISIKSGLRSLLIDGYTRQNGSVDKSPHEWCTVFIDSSWALYDPTWDESVAHQAIFSGNADYNYFQVSPALFIQSHMPFDPMFQLMNCPVSYKEFNNGNIGADRLKPYFNYADSIGVYEKSNPFGKYLSAASRIEKNGTPNTMISNKLNKLKMDMEIIYQDRDTTLYNAAVANYNHALAIFNTFLYYRNNRFTPAKTDIEIQDIFGSIETEVASANNKLNEVNRSQARLTLNTLPLEKALNDFSGRVKAQQDFLRDYLNSVKVK